MPLQVPFPPHTKDAAKRLDASGIQSSGFSFADQGQKTEGDGAQLELLLRQSPLGALVHPIDDSLQSAGSGLAGHVLKCGATCRGSKWYGSNEALL